MNFLFFAIAQLSTLIAVGILITRQKNFIGKELNFQSNLIEHLLRPMPYLKKIDQLPLFMQDIRSYMPERDNIPLTTFDAVLLDIYNNYLRKMYWSELKAKYSELIPADDLFYMASTFEVWYSVTIIKKPMVDVKLQFPDYDIALDNFNRVKFQRKKQYA